MEDENVSNSKNDDKNVNSREVDKRKEVMEELKNNDKDEWNDKEGKDEELDYNV